MGIVSQQATFIFAPRKERESELCGKLMNHGDRCSLFIKAIRNLGLIACESSHKQQVDTLLPPPNFVFFFFTVCLFRWTCSYGWRIGCSRMEEVGSYTIPSHFNLLSKGRRCLLCFQLEKKGLSLSSNDLPSTHRPGVCIHLLLVAFSLSFTPSEWRGQAGGAPMSPSVSRRLSPKGLGPAAGCLHKNAAFLVAHETREINNRTAPYRHWVGASIFRPSQTVECESCLSSAHQCLSCWYSNFIKSSILHFIIVDDMFLTFTNHAPIPPNSVESIVRKWFVSSAKWIRVFVLSGRN